ncbi:MAG: PglZ domain-containing protein [Bacteroidetes bacterium]|nr:MAG: PglZ domain-containing protein [Bacteroidota bacterium]
MNKISILWADDEIDLLKPHILFLQEKGYDVKTAISGDEAVGMIKAETFDVVFLDENMPGLSGLETLSRIKDYRSDLPIVMITKSEAEQIMEDAIGSKISDYLIKPVNPNQILLSLKKIFENKRLVSEKTTSNYQQEFRQIGMSLSDDHNAENWKDIYKKLVFWELELDKSDDESMSDMLAMQKQEANAAFSKFIEANYIKWLHSPLSAGKAGAEGAPLMSHTVLKSKLNPLLDRKEPIFLVVIDNLRFDQWKMIEPKIKELFKVEEESLYYSILPTVTQFARNALFAGLMPSEIEKIRPDLWRNEEDEGSKNQFEQEFMNAQLKRWGRDIKSSYHKIVNHNEGKKLADSISNLMQNKLNVIVYNFVDMLSHARTEMEVIRELADDESAYRSLTVSWFEHSPLHDIIKKIAEKKGSLVITTDHGSIRVSEPSKVVGDKNTSTNLRYKQGKSLSYEKRDVLEVKNPADAFLPRINVSTTYIFAKQDKFFVYPNNFNHYAHYYRNTIQHGGISLEEMLIPFVTLSAKQVI